MIVGKKDTCGHGSDVKRFIQTRQSGSFLYSFCGENPIRDRLECKTVIVYMRETARFTLR